jgi:enoyl-CoA hydratase/crotonobetainyl-CoA hydratase
VRNAIDLPTAEEIAAALDDFEARPEIRAIVITGRGGIFSAGMDLKALTATNQRPITASRGAFGVVERPPAKPMIAAVEGAALGGGLEIAMAADVIVVAENARLGLPEVARGLVATAGGVLRLPSRVPRAVALEMIMTGAPISAERAYQIGLVNHVVPDGSALIRAVDLAQTVAANAPMAVRAAKAVALNAVHWGDSDGFMLQRRYTDPVRESADAAEGARAFVEKRPPVWQDA